MLRKTHVWMAAIVASCISMSTNAQTLYTYDNDEDGLPGTVASGVSASDLSWVNGPVFINACGEGFNSDTWSLSTDPFNTDYSAVQLTLTPDFCTEMTVTGIQFDVRRNPQGPESMRYAYSTDGGASWVDAGADFAPDDNPCGSGDTYFWDIADFTTASAVIFRIYGWNASTVNGQQSMLNGFVYGTSAATPSTWYADADGDGYGDPDMTTLACEMPEGYVADNTDCNDADAAVNPAAEEICGNGIDDNCDGIVEDGITASANIDGAAPVCAPLTVTLTASPADAGNTYQWYRNGAALAGETGSTFVATALRGHYQVMVTNDFCSDMSDSTYVRIYDPNDPLITTFAGTDLCVNNPIKLKATFGFAPEHTYQWYRNDVAIPGANTAKYNATEPGEYYVNVFAAYPGCSYWSESITLTADCRLEAPAAVSTIDVYPNPGNGNITIDMNAAAQEGSANLVIVNMIGEVVYTATVNYANASIVADINLSGRIPAGMYTIIVNENGAFTQQQFIVQN